MNAINTPAHRSLVSLTANHTCVDSFILLEDDGFLDMLRNIPLTMTMPDALRALVRYVEANY